MTTIAFYILYMDEYHIDQYITSRFRWINGEFARFQRHLISYHRWLLIFDRKQLIAVMLAFALTLSYFIYSIRSTWTDTVDSSRNNADLFIMIQHVQNYRVCDEIQESPEIGKFWRKLWQLLYRSHNTKYSELTSYPECCDLFDFFHKTETF